MAIRRAAIAASIFLPLAACGDSGARDSASKTSTIGQQSLTVAGPVDAFVKAHAPKAEVRLINSAEQFSTRKDTIKDSGDPLDTRMAQSWRESVLGAMNFTGWVAYVDHYEPSGRIYLKMTHDMFLWTDVPKDSSLIASLRSKRSGHQAIYITGRIANDDAVGLKGALDGKSPTCFEAASGPQGCHVELTDLRPLAVVD